METIHDRFRREGLVRPRDTRFFAGVATGLGRRLGLDPWPSRLLFVLALLVLHVSVVVAYVVLWILMPVEQTAPGPVEPPAAYPAA